MRLLLDTHAFLSDLTDDPRLRPVSLELIIYGAQLPLHHRDPVDRLLMALAISCPFTLLSPDGAIRADGCALQDARS